VTFYRDKFGDILLFLCSNVSSVGVTGVQTIGKNHTSQVMGHGLRGSGVSSLMGHMGHGSHMGHSCDPLSALGRMGFNAGRKNRDPDCKFPPNVQPGSSFGALILYFRIQPQHRKFHKSNPGSGSNPGSR